MPVPPLVGPKAPPILLSVRVDSLTAKFIVSEAAVPVIVRPVPAVIVTVSVAESATGLVPDGPAPVSPALAPPPPALSAAQIQLSRASSHFRISLLAQPWRSESRPEGNSSRPEAEFAVADKPSAATVNRLR